MCAGSRKYRNFYNKLLKLCNTLRERSYRITYNNLVSVKLANEVYAILIWFNIWFEFANPVNFGNTHIFHFIA